MDAITGLVTFLGSQGTVGFILLAIIVFLVIVTYILQKVARRILIDLNEIKNRLTHVNDRVLKIETYLELKDDDFKPYRGS